jgi:hypothetical protein
VSVNGDTDVEPDEWFLISFHDPTNATIGGFYGLGVGIIRNDDVLPKIVPSSASISEGDAGSQLLTSTVSLSAPSDKTVTADWTTLHSGTSAAQAEPPVDYTATSGVVTFTPGQTSQSVSVSVNGDTDVEPDEWFLISFHDPTNATIGGFYGLGVGIIRNDD